MLTQIPYTNAQLIREATTTHCFGNRLTSDENEFERGGGEWRRQQQKRKKNAKRKKKPTRRTYAVFVVVMNSILRRNPIPLSKLNLFSRFATFFSPSSKTRRQHDEGKLARLARFSHSKPKLRKNVLFISEKLFAAASFSLHVVTYFLWR